MVQVVKDWVVMVAVETALVVLEREEEEAMVRVIDKYPEASLDLVVTMEASVKLLAKQVMEKVAKKVAEKVVKEVVEGVRETWVDGSLRIVRRNPNNRDPMHICCIGPQDHRHHRFHRRDICSQCVCTHIQAVNQGL